MTGSTRVPGAPRERGLEPGDRGGFEFPLGRRAARVIIGGAGLTVHATAGNGVLVRQADLSDATPYALILAAIDLATANIAVRR